MKAIDALELAVAIVIGVILVAFACSLIWVF